MLHTKFKVPEPYSSGEEDFKYISYLKQGHPPQGHFGPQGLHLNKFGNGLLGNIHVTHQISRPEV